MTTTRPRCTRCSSAPSTRSAAPLAGWMAGLVALAVTMLALYPTIRGNQQFSKLFESYPEAFRSMFGVSDYTSGPGYLRAEFLAHGTAAAQCVLYSVGFGSDRRGGAAPADHRRADGQPRIEAPGGAREVGRTCWSGPPSQRAVCG